VDFCRHPFNLCWTCLDRQSSTWYPDSAKNRLITRYLVPGKKLAFYWLVFDWLGFDWVGFDWLECDWLVLVWLGFDWWAFDLWGFDDYDYRLNLVRMLWKTPMLCIPSDLWDYMLSGLLGFFSAGIFRVIPAYMAPVPWHSFHLPLSRLPDCSIG